MKGIKSYLSIIEPLLLNQITGKPKELLEIIKEFKYENEKELIQKFCGTRYSEKYYYVLKDRTRKILQSLAIVSSVKSSGKVKQRLDLCRKNFTIGQKFLEEGETDEGLRLIKQAHRDAIKYDFVHLACELSNTLYFHYVYYKRNRKKAAHYAEQVNYYLDAYRVEKQAEFYVFEVIAQTKGSADLAYLQKAIKELQTLEGKSLKFHTYQFMLSVIHGFHTMEYKLAAGICYEALKFYQGKRGVYISHYLFFYTNLGIAQIARKKHDEAEHAFLDAVNYIHPRSINEYILALYRTINAIHAGQYQMAYDLYRQHRKCRFEEVRQQFAIIEAYLCFLSHMGYFQLDRIFRLGKYLNETFKAQADKQGQNIAILIAELLVYLARDRGKFIDRVDAIKHYSYRHLKNKDTSRAKRFIKILCLMPRANFKPDVLERLAKPDIQYLQDHPIYMGENVSIEIIPFETLLQMILIQLNEKVA